MFRARGNRGRVWVDTKLAIDLGRWSLEQDALLGSSPHATVQATVTRVDPFWSTQRPFTLALDMGRAWWIWTDTVCQQMDPLIMRISGEPTVKED